MTYLQITENTKQARLMLEYLKTLEFIKVIDKPSYILSEDEEFNVEKFMKALDEKPEEEHTMLEQIAAGLRDVKRMQDGKIPKQSLSEVLQEIKEELVHE